MPVGACCFSEEKSKICAEARADTWSTSQLDAMIKLAFHCSSASVDQDHGAGKYCLSRRFNTMFQNTWALIRKGFFDFTNHITMDQFETKNVDTHGKMVKTASTAQRCNSL